MTAPKNAADQVKAGRSEADRVLIFDTTLRDGEQSPGAAMTLEDKLKVADLLDEMGVDIIEAGFPISSNGDFEAVSEIAKLVKNSVVCGLARAGLKDIDRAGEAVRHAKRPRIHTFISTSPVHRKWKLQMDAEQVIEAVAQSVAHARKYVDDVEWSAGGRHPHRARRAAALLRGGDQGRRHDDQHSRYGRLLGAGGVLRAHQDAARDGARRRQGGVVDALPQRPRHGGRQLAGRRQGGARQIECSINGLGERAGNAALEEIVMALNVRGDVLPYWTGVDATKFTRASKLVSAVAAFPVQYNKAIVGRNAFAHESGIHQDGMLKNNQTYEIMTPESVGLAKSSLSMGKLSGRHAFREKLRELGYELGDNAFQDAFNRFKDLADKKKIVFDEDIEALVDQEVASQSDRIKVVALTVIAGTGGPQKATHHARRRRHAARARGDGRRSGGRDVQGDQGHRAARGALCRSTR